MPQGSSWAKTYFYYFYFIIVYFSGSNGKKIKSWQKVVKQDMPLYNNNVIRLLHCHFQTLILYFGLWCVMIFDFDCMFVCVCVFQQDCDEFQQIRKNIEIHCSKPHMALEQKVLKMI